ncbi:hypothetical protein PIB30_004545 [Stylosanthes scabra]|uniref:Uncharacterized protein n=1 Tax=Stylosanthes scabra TaxID=79078 RepID=A0ABU6Y1T5_9FABA|nr:hypothetical protein [Stylosanthes scabra]
MANIDKGLELLRPQPPSRLRPPQAPCRLPQPPTAVVLRRRVLPPSRSLAPSALLSPSLGLLSVNLSENPSRRRRGGCLNQRTLAVAVRRSPSWRLSSSPARRVQRRSRSTTIVSAFASPALVRHPYLDCSNAKATIWN